MAQFSRQEFTKHLNTKFNFKVEGSKPIDLELIEVTGYMGQEGEEQGMERFSLFFTAPDGILLPQHTYAVEHEQLGAFELFLVPLGPKNGNRYEAVFNSYR
jgi:hypothetical protein